MRPVVSLSNVSKKYRSFGNQRDRLVETLSFGRKQRGRDFWALRDVNLEVGKGASLGVLGRNGAGKSTLLTVVSGVLQPTTGSVEVDGRLAALLQLGAGFKPEYTGRENAMLNGLILGVDRKEMIRRFDEIEAFADLGEFMDRPVKTYSSGMKSRLGFAVAVHVEPDVLLVDEALSVGDAVYKHAGVQKMQALKESGTTVMFVSHSLDMVRNFCSEAVLLHEGRVVVHGETEEALDRYGALVSEISAGRGEGSEYISLAEGADALEEPAFREDPDLESDRMRMMRHGTGEARVRNVEVLDEHGRPAESTAPGSPLTIGVHVEYAEDAAPRAVRVILRNTAGLDLFSTTNADEGRPLGPRRAGERVIVDFSLRDVPLRHGTYSVTAGILDVGVKNVYLDWVGVAAVFELGRPPDRKAYHGLIHIPAEVEVFSPDREQSGSSGRAV